MHENVADIPTEGLTQELLTLLGDSVSKKAELGAPLQNELADRWTSIMKNGLSEGERTSILNNYPPPSNCLLLQTPKLNQLIETAVSDSVKRRDNRLELLQKQIGAGLTAVGGVLNSILREEVGGENHHRYIKALSDAGRLLTDIHHSETVSRRELVSYNLNKDLKHTLNEAPLDEWLFGGDLEERVKATKSLERAALELKPQRPKQVRNSLPRNLNFRGPSQAGYQGVRRSGQQQPRRAPYQPQGQPQRRQESYNRQIQVRQNRVGRTSVRHRK